MKRAITTAVLAAAVGAAGGFVGRDYSNVGPIVQPPQATSIVVRGPTEGFAGREYFFHAALRGDHGKPTWIVSPECDLTTSDDGTMARLRCDNPDLYTLTVTVGGRDASVAADVAFFQAIDVDAEINQAVSEATAVAASEPQPPTLGQVVAALPSFQVLDHDQRVTAASQFALMSQRLQAGLVPSDSDPLKLLQGVLGESYREFLADVSAVVDELKLSGQVTTAASYAPVCSEVAAALGE